MSVGQCEEWREIRLSPTLIDMQISLITNIYIFTQTWQCFRGNSRHVNKIHRFLSSSGRRAWQAS